MCFVYSIIMQFGKVYIGHLKEYGNKDVYLSRLRKFIETGTIPPSRRKRTLSLTTKQIADLFTMNLVLAALHAHRVTPGLSEAAIDTLCVASLVQFPPTEAGPLNFSARIGQKSILAMFNKYTKVVPFLADVSGSKTPYSLLIGSIFLDLFSSGAVCKTESTESNLVAIFQHQRSELILLSQEELQKVGGARGVQSRELFLIPLVMLALVIMSLCVLVAGFVILYLTMMC